MHFLNFLVMVNCNNDTIQGGNRKMVAEEKDVYSLVL